MISYVRRCLGYALTADTSEQALFILHGRGANGKSTLTNTVLHIMGDYGKKASADSFLKKRNEGPGNDLAGMLGARLVAASEPDSSKWLNESRLKEITGGEPVSVRHLYKEFFTYTPTWKLFLSANHRPGVPDSSAAFWRRVHLIPFEVKIPDDQQDKKLLEKLKGEAPGILAWMVTGALKWQQKGLNPPREVLEAKEIYQEETDPLADFMKDKDLVVGPGGRIAKRELYELYVDWCGDKRKPMSHIAFSRLLSGRFKDKRVGKTKELFWEGIGRKVSLRAVK
jgi:putative DNA primase/helicase